MCDIFHPAIRLLKPVRFLSENCLEPLIDFVLCTIPFRISRSVVWFVLLYCEFTVWWFVHVSHCFSFGYCIVCPLIYGFWFHLWYLQTVLWSVVVMCVLLSLYSIFSRNLIHCVHGKSRPIQSNLPMWSPLLSNHMY